MRRLAQRAWIAWATTAHNGQSSSSALSSTAACGLRYRATSAAAAATTAAEGAAPAAAGASPWTPLSAVMFIPSAVCGFLAYWQYERMQWKDDLIRIREGVANAEPTEIFMLDEPAEYDKVQVRGRYLHEYSLYVGPRPRSVPGSGILPGYLVITPMVSADRKGVVLVNRGWVPSSWKQEAQAAAAAKIRETEAAAAAKAEAEAKEAAAASTAAAVPASRGWWGRKAQPQQQPAVAEAAAPKAPEVQTVVGVIQPDEQPSQFMPDNKPDSDEFHFLQRGAMARVLGLPADTPLVMAISTDPTAVVSMQKRSPLDDARAAALAAEADPATGDAPAAAAYPAPKHVGDLVRFTTMPSDHRNYALIWVTLCLTLAAMARTAVTRPLRGPRIVEAAGSATGARDAWKASQAS